MASESFASELKDTFLLEWTTLTLIQIGTEHTLKSFIYLIISERTRQML